MMIPFLTGINNVRTNMRGGSEKLHQNITHFVEADSECECDRSIVILKIDFFLL